MCVVLPLSSERFEVEPQGPGAEVAGLGVAVALRKLLSSWTEHRSGAAAVKAIVRNGRGCYLDKTLNHH